LGDEARRRLMSTFHCALDHARFLFLGSSEAIANVPELFSTVDAKWRIFRREQSAALIGTVHPAVSARAHARGAIVSRAPKEIERALLEQIPPWSSIRTDTSFISMAASVHISSRHRGAPIE
jgi:two-component system CheB/CheR fusion protein